MKVAPTNDWRVGPVSTVSTVGGPKLLYYKGLLGYSMSQLNFWEFCDRDIMRYISCDWQATSYTGRCV